MVQPVRYPARQVIALGGAELGGAALVGGKDHVIGHGIPRKEPERALRRHHADVQEPAARAAEGKRQDDSPPRRAKESTCGSAAPGSAAPAEAAVGSVPPPRPRTRTATPPAVCDRRRPVGRPPDAPGDSAARRARDPPPACCPRRRAALPRRSGALGRSFDPPQRRADLVAAVRQLPQPFAAARQARHDGADGDAEHAGGFGVRQVLHRDQQDDGALLDRQAG